MTQKKQFVRRHSTESGFTLIEVLIAAVIMTVGLLALMATFVATIHATEFAQENLIARHKALAIMEGIYTARNSQQEPFAAINNIANGGIFKSGAQPMLCAGTDGIIGTADDAACTAPDTGVACPGGVECLVLPGPDGILGTPDDVTESLSNFTRTITFYPVFLPSGAVNTNLIGVTVTVSWIKPGQQTGPPYNYTVNGLVSSYH
ncbi:MAG: prepilin-type N-terminal cleavage/methylation domain-containing protein [Candidatus Sulfotelmatobacter sp.]